MYVIIFHCHLIYFSFFTILSTLLVLSHYELVSQLWNTWNFTNLYERSHTNKVWLIDWMVRTVKNQKVEADVVEGARNSSTCFLSGVVWFFFFFPRVNIEFCFSAWVLFWRRTRVFIQKREASLPLFPRLVWVARSVCVLGVLPQLLECLQMSYTSLSPAVIWSCFRLLLLSSACSPSLRPFIHPSIPVANKQRSSIPAVPPVKASVLWRAAHIVVSDKASLSVE